jgi:V8-like Glu-specific endopeptidase
MKLVRPILPVLLLLALISPTRSSAGAARAEMSQAVSMDLAGDPAAVRAYWNPKRMRNAPARTAPTAFEPGEAELSTSLVPTYHRQAPPTESRRSSRSLSTFAAAGKAPIPYSRTEIADPSLFPHRTNGRLFGIGANGEPYSCSATSVSSQNNSVVWTAGHCVYLQEIGGQSSNIIFVPGYHNGASPYGEWAALEAWMPTGWTGFQSPSYDMAALVVAPDQDGVLLEDMVGGRGIAWNLSRDMPFDAFGYPANPPFTGETLWVCDSQYGVADPLGFSPIPRTTAIGCDMHEGSSGGGWIIRDQYLNGVNSYGVEGFPEVMFGPYFTSQAASLYQQASISTAAGPLPPELPAAPLVGTIHRMKLTLRIIGHLTIQGQMRATDGYAQCARGAPVGIFRVFRGRLSLMKIVTTDRRGSFEHDARDLPGRYLAFGPEGSVDDLNPCSEVRSPFKKHKHRR